MASPRVVGVLLTALTLSCHTSPTSITVGVIFNNSWRLGNESLGESDVALIRRTVFETLRHAYTGFAVHFRDGEFGVRMIRVEDTPFVSDWPRSRTALGAAGVTYPAATVSSVRFDVVVSAALAAAQCENITRCTKSRTEMIEGLGRGIGATAAHELGHQAGFGFAIDSRCDDCYDGSTSRSYAHFFGQKHWSDAALIRMKLVLPAA